MTGPNCEKCRSKDVGTSYHGQGCPKKNCSCTSCGYSSHNKQHTEHLHYFCRNCRYDWIGPVAA